MFVVLYVAESNTGFDVFPGDRAAPFPRRHFSVGILSYYAPNTVVVFPSSGEGEQKNKGCAHCVNIFWRSKL